MFEITKFLNELNREPFPELLNIDLQEQGYSMPENELEDYIEKLIYYPTYYSEFINEGKDMFIIYDGNPKTTLKILISAIIYNKKLLLFPDNSYIAINIYLCSCYNQVMNNNNNKCDIIRGYNTTESEKCTSNIYIGTKEIYLEVLNTYPKTHFIMETL